MKKKTSIALALLTALGSIFLSIILWFVFHIPFFIFAFFLPCVFPLLQNGKERTSPVCPNCGARLRGDENFCFRCGKDLRQKREG